MRLFEKQLGREEIYQGKLLHLVKDRVLLENGKETVREMICHQGAVCVVPMTPEGDVYMVRQFRYPFGRVLLEAPAGKIDPGEDPLSCAKRELEEETGLRADSYLELGEYYPTPAYATEVIALYLATSLHPAQQHLDADEFLEVEKIPLQQLVEQVVQGEIRDGKTIAAILKVEYLRGQGKLDIFSKQGD